MARIRSIKPELPTDRTLARCSRDARYTFVLLITQADDQGLVLAEPRQLLGQLYPHDEDVTAEILDRWVQELVEKGLIRRRQTKDEAAVIEISRWKEHQYINKPGKPLLLQKLLPFSDNAPEKSGMFGEYSEKPPKKSSADRERELGKGTRNVRVEVDDLFEKAWLSYPKRPNNSKTKAFRAWCARLADGERPEVMLTGVAAYAAYVARSNTEARFVKLASTFFGPDKPYLDDYGTTDEPVRLYTDNGDMPQDIARLFGANRGAAQ